MQIAALLLFPLLLGGDSLPQRYQGLAKTKATKLERIWGTPEQHVFLVNRVAYSRDGRMALVASADLGEKDADDDISVWDLEKSQVVRVLSIKKAVATCIAIAPDGKHAVMATVAGEPNKEIVRLLYWNLATGKIVRDVEGTKKGIVCLAFSSDGKQLLAGGSEGPVQHWNIADGKLLHTLEGTPSAVYCAAFSPDGKQALTGGGGDLHLRLWDLQTGKELSKWHAGPHGLTAVQFLPDGKRAVSVAADQIPILWDIKEKKELQKYKREPLGNGVTPLAVSADGKRLISLRTPYNQLLNATEQFATCWDVDGGKEVWSARIDLPLATPLALIEADKTLLFGGGESCFVHLDAATGKEKKLWGGHRGGVVHIAVEPKSGYFWTASSDKTVKRWSASGGVEFFTFKPHDDSLTGMAIAGDQLFTVSGDKTLKVWTLSKAAAAPPKLVNKFEGHTGGITCLAVSADGKLILTGSSDRSIKVWDHGTAKELLKTMTGHSHAVTAVALSPDGRWAASGSEDSTVRLWYLPKDGKDVEPVIMDGGHGREVTQVLFTPDGKYVLSSSQDQTVKLWDVSTGKEVKTLKGHKNWITAMAYRAESKLLVTVCDDLTVKLWNVETGKEIDSLDLGSASDVGKSVTFAPDGRAFYVGTANWLVLRFEVK